MARAHTAELVKRACVSGDAQAAVQLLEHSIALGHRRIALIRYLHAQYLCAPLVNRHHDYVRRIAARMSPATLAQVVREARERTSRAHSGSGLL